MRIGFVRHGETDWNKETRAQGQRDIPLNQTGLLQARAVAERMRLELSKWDVLISSDLSRAYVTAQAIGTLLNKTVGVDLRLRERGFGQLEGTTEQERIDQWGPNWNELEHGVETLQQVRERSDELLAELIEKYSGQNILLVSHGTFIGVALKSLLEADIPVLGNTAISIIRREDQSWRSELINCFKHLSPSIEVGGGLRNEP
ncbi:histidine phosphatase family protein [Paenibacillus cremeus]|uniref:Histidine phosphatase family protein n=1 Tax=Paenibacillus cremeus TaxID=2163881 RepID=A0A559JRC2_9BACL|nr:histidine phosphatase family protein [Paenibacillus cremeus]TVY02422.1 histidine phosphatase family protein [Paenibacillus cremeus]